MLTLVLVSAVGSWAIVTTVCCLGFANHLRLHAAPRLAVGFRFGPLVAGLKVDKTRLAQLTHRGAKWIILVTN